MPASSGSRESPRGEERAVEPRSRSRPSASSLSSKPSCSIAEPTVGLGPVAIDTALHELVDLVVGDQPDLLGLPDQRRVRQDHARAAGGGAGADEAAHQSRRSWRLVTSGNSCSSAPLISVRVVGLRQRRGSRVPCGIDHRRVEVDVELDRTPRGTPASPGDDREQQDAQKRQGQARSQPGPRPLSSASRR